MANEEKNQNETQEQSAHVSTSTSLDDEQRVKVLSPGMLVARRFFRNRLAMIGLVIIICMFLFSFIGGIITPYSEKEIFRTTEETLKDYAGVTQNTDWQYEVAEGKDFPAAAKAEIILAINKGEETFTSKGVEYMLVKHSDQDYLVVQAEAVGTVITLGGRSTYKEIQSGAFSDQVKAAYEEAAKAKETSFTVDSVLYTISAKGRVVTVNKASEVALATKLIFSAASRDITLGFDFRKTALQAMADKATEFTVGSDTYQLEQVEENYGIITKDSNQYAIISTYSIQPTGNDAFLSLEFREATENAIKNEQNSFQFAGEDGKEVEYTIERKNTQYLIRANTVTYVYDTFSSPSSTHLLGTDGNGMDILTRLMYGGRISLMVGFVVVVLELLLGVIMGGLAGYFGGWVDTLVMRLVEIFYCIPAIPLYIILGSIMDFRQIDPKVRIYILCAMLGLLGWASVARMVRGQILSLREQEFMMAAEATGISIHRRIFIHLIPNVIPQLIVLATMDLGNTILTEATLSFLGLGVKFPFASWGNIINAVNDSYVMTNYLFAWIPAGLLILFTVLGFNFIGDGLRDAFDPKMKR